MKSSSDPRDTCTQEAPALVPVPEDRLRLLDHAVNHVTDALMITEAEPLAEPGPRIVYVNRAFEIITGYSAAEVIGRSPRFLKAPEINPAACDRIREALRGHRPVCETVLNRRKDGTLFWIELQISPVLDAAGGVTHFAAVERDVTQRMRVLQLLEDSKRRLDEAEALAQVGSWEWDILRDEAHWSDEMYRICGLEPQSRTVTRMAFRQMVHPEDQDSVHALVDEALDKRRTIEREFRIIRPDGTMRHVAARGSVVCDAAGCPVRLVGCMQDITDKVEADRAILKAERLEAANKELEAFSYSVAHDLRAPVRRILNYLAIVDEPANRTGFTDEVRQCLAGMQSSAELMNQLINDMLALAQVVRRPMKREPCDLTQMAQQILAGFAANDRQRSVEVHVEPGLTVRADPSLVRILLENILSNAWKFTRRRADARIVMKREPVDREQPVFSVEDNGVGFDSAYAHHLFRPFERLHQTKDFEGTGIGLTTVQRIVARHGGFVRAEGRVGQGAKFIFCLE